MNAVEARQRYTHLVWEPVRATPFPSAPMLNRVEQTLRTPEDVEAYVDLLFDKVQGDYPSLQILGRIRRMVGVLELLGAAQDQGVSSQ